MRAAAAPWKSLVKNFDGTLKQERGHISGQRAPPDQIEARPAAPSRGKDAPGFGAMFRGKFYEVLTKSLCCVVAHSSRMGAVLVQITMAFRT